MDSNHNEENYPTHKKDVHSGIVQALIGAIGGIVATLILVLLPYYLNIQETKKVEEQENQSQEDFELSVETESLNSDSETAHMTRFPQEAYGVTWTYFTGTSYITSASVDVQKELDENDSDAVDGLGNQYSIVMKPMEYDSYIGKELSGNYKMLEGTFYRRYSPSDSDFAWGSITIAGEIGSDSGIRAADVQDLLELYSVMLSSYQDAVHFTVPVDNVNELKITFSGHLDVAIGDLVLWS